MASQAKYARRRRNAFLAAIALALLFIIVVILIIVGISKRSGGNSGDGECSGGYHSRHAAHA